jgi:hypothetical protein
MATASTGNVRALRGSELPVLGIAATAGLGNRIAGSRNEIWLCHAYGFNQEPLMLYVKLGLSTRAMMVEALCAQIAQCIGLACPSPYLVTVNPKHVGRPAGARVLAFGALDVSTKSMARPIRALDTLLELLQSMKVADLACAFDEWIGNDVRSPSDILVSPELSTVFLIDHEAAIGAGHTPDVMLTNWLAERLAETFTIEDRLAFLNKVRARLAALYKASLGPAPMAAQYSQDGVQVYESLVEFLRVRLTHMDRLISQRFFPEQQYLVETPENTTDHDAHRTSEL